MMNINGSSKMRYLDIECSCTVYRAYLLQIRIAFSSVHMGVNESKKPEFESIQPA